MDLFIIDGNSPFFLHAPHRRINWSKVPFEQLETDGQPEPERWHDVETAFRTFAQRAAATGYNTITLDDVAHIADTEAYPPKVRTQLATYRTWYRRLFSIARDNGLRILLTTDVMFQHRLAPVQ